MTGVQTGKVGRFVQISVGYAEEASLDGQLISGMERPRHEAALIGLKMCLAYFSIG